MGTGTGWGSRSPATDTSQGNGRDERGHDNRGWDSTPVARRQESRVWTPALCAKLYDPRQDVTSGHARSELARVVTTPAYARQTETNDARLRQRHDGDENVYRDAPHGVVCRARAAALCHTRLGPLLHATNNSNGTNLCR